MFQKQRQASTDFKSKCLVVQICDAILKISYVKSTYQNSDGKNEYAITHRQACTHTHTEAYTYTGTLTLTHTHTYTDMHTYLVMQQTWTGEQ